MNRFVVSFIMFFYPLLSGCANRNPPLWLVFKGKTDFTVIIPPNAKPVEKKAAAILRDYFDRVTGISLQICDEDSASNSKHAIYVGSTHKQRKVQQEIAGEGFAISTDDNNIYIHGGSGQGVIYAVYSFVEHELGCKKLDGGAAMCPHNINIPIAQDLTRVENPGFEYRQSYYPMSQDPEYLQWHKLHRFEDLWGLWGHSFFKIVPPKINFNTHPEYFAEVNGQRKATQLCLSNEAVYELTVSYLKKAMERNPDAVYWSVAQNDGGGYCTCPLCRKKDSLANSHQGSLLSFVNRVAQAFPQVKFTTLAYQYSQKAPVNIKPAKNVYIMLSTIDADRAAPLEKAASAGSFRKDLNAWSKLTDNIFVWDYTVQFTHYLTPFPDYIHTGPNSTFFKNKGVKGVLFQGPGESYGDMSELNSYVQAELLWNPTANSDSLVQEFIINYYGRAAPAMQEYVTLITKNACAANVSLDIYGDPVNNIKNYLSASLMDQYGQLLNRATLLAQNDPVTLARVQRAQLSLTYVALVQSRYYTFGNRGCVNEQGNLRTIKTGWMDKVQKFVSDCSNSGVTTLAEVDGGLQQYLDNWKKVAATTYLRSLAEDCDVKFLQLPESDYLANGPKTLNDGIFGTKDYSFNWLFWVGKNMEYVLDFNRPLDIRSINIRCLEDERHYIAAPNSLDVSMSEDGKTYHTIKVNGIKSPRSEENNSNIYVVDYRIQAGPGKIRYIKVHGDKKASAEGERKFSICSDEIEVF